MQLEPGTQYEIRVGGNELRAHTWSERFAVAKTITVGNQSTLAITQGGSASGYVLYSAAPAISTRTARRRN